jgi:hypothetical protein
VIISAKSQDLNEQQTLKNDINFLTRSLYLNQRAPAASELTQSLTNGESLRKSALISERELAKSIRDNYFYNSKEQLNGIPMHKLRGSQRPNTSESSKYVTLPVSKTLVHNKPWSYGHVDGNIYYPFRSQKIGGRSK